MYAVELYFAAPFEQYVRELWKGLNDEGITSNMDEIKFNRPHVSLSVYSKLPDAESVIQRLVAYFQNVSSIEMKFASLAAFPTTGTLFMNPCVTRELIDLHTQYHDAFQDLHEYASMYYIPGNWTPHCTLAFQLSPDQLMEAMKFCYGRFSPQITTVTEAGLVKLEFDQNHKCVSSTPMEIIRLV
jgi:2'-5' RNA ligase